MPLDSNLLHLTIVLKIKCLIIPSVQSCAFWTSYLSNLPSHYLRLETLKAIRLLLMKMTICFAIAFIKSHTWQNSQVKKTYQIILGISDPFWSQWVFTLRTSFNSMATSLYSDSNYSMKNQNLHVSLQAAYPTFTILKVIWTSYSELHHGSSEAKAKKYWCCPDLYVFQGNPFSLLQQSHSRTSFFSNSLSCVFAWYLKISF